MDLRLKRRQIFERPTPAPLTAIIHEAALRMQFGGRDVARAQLEHLLSESERDHVGIHVIPFSAGGFPGAGQSITCAHGPVPRLDTVQLDSSHEGPRRGLVMGEPPGRWHAWAWPGPGRRFPH